ncbi:TM2 domain-containing membrane protein YozV [Peribacillus deserti]|uniref:TM2 domain-containing membrane protein YozV n=1 Tax=Peribacillus deserti TaxID=673318 RepID=A0ABS2QNY5_9BACI|nr:hypothetical protein [Peribacillus deserti]MBM7694884.1 TM2 domain-containing membrane protein YozV [Peribacillus deserti]
MKQLKKSKRLPRNYLGLIDTPMLHFRNPYIVAGWSVTFPGFGHLILGKYFRGFALIIWEGFINQYSKVNMAMVYSFNGDISAAKDILNIRLLLLYMPVYFFAIWDSYRTTVDLNNEFKLSERDKSPLRKYTMNSFGINYLDKRSPNIATLWALFIPSLGQTYQHRTLSGLFTLIWAIVYTYNSHLIEAIVYLILGDINQSTQVLDMQWALFIPSFYFFTIFDAYVNTVELNKIFDKEQKDYLINNFQPSNYKIKKGRLVK